jgi:hypothetical protein
MGFAGRSEAISHVAGDCFVLKDAGAIANYAPRNDCPKVETHPRGLPIGWTAAQSCGMMRVTLWRADTA